MDTVFFLNEEDRANFLIRIIHSLRCTYAVLWWSYTHLPYPNNFLMSSGGIYHEDHNQAGSSSGSTARSLFDEYRQLPFSLENERVPGLAFKNNIPYTELNQENLQKMASSETQLQFYQEAKIKFAVFVGCRSGEIEMGFSNLPNANIEMEIKNLFPDDFSGQSLARELAQQSNWPSSSFGSQSMHSTDTFSPILITSITPTLKSEEDAITRAYLAALTSSSSSLQQNQQNILLIRRGASAFRNYLSAMSTTRTNLTRHSSMFERAIGYYRWFNIVRQEQMLQSLAPTSSIKLHHMISERKRRERLKENFQALKALLPPETKKDKASVLISTREYLNSLKAQIAELSRRNQLLEAQTNEKLDVRISYVSESTSQGERLVDLGVTLRGETLVADVVFRILEFLRQVRTVHVMSMDANTHLVETTPFNHVVLRLKIDEGSEWDESALQEAVKRAVADLGR